MTLFEVKANVYKTELQLGTKNGQGWVQGTRTVRVGLYPGMGLGTNSGYGYRYRYHLRVPKGHGYGVYGYGYWSQYPGIQVRVLEYGYRCGYLQERFCAGSVESVCALEENSDTYLDGIRMKIGLLQQRTPSTHSGTHGYQYGYQYEYGYTGIMYGQQFWVRVRTRTRTYGLGLACCQIRTRARPLADLESAWTHESGLVPTLH